VPSAADLEAQAAADRDQEQADADYRELSRLAVGVVLCVCDDGSCLVYRGRRWLAAGL
jgi:hypothetical protein